MDDDPVLLWATCVAIARKLEGQYPAHARELVDSACAHAVRIWWNAGSPVGPCPIRETLPAVPPPATPADLLREVERVAPPSVGVKARHLSRALSTGQPSKGKPARTWVVTADDL